MKPIVKVPLYFCLVVCLFNCKKDITSTNFAGQASEKYLTFKDYDELNKYVSAVPTMSNGVSPKTTSNPNFKSLYDHYLELQRKVEEKQENLEAINEVIGKDSMYFYVSDDFRLRFKNVSELSSRFVSSDGLIKIGNCLMKYYGDKIYYTDTDYESLLKEDFAKQRSVKILELGEILKNVRIESKNGSSSMKIRPISTPPKGQNLGFLTIVHFADRYQWNRKRFYMDLLEDITIAPHTPVEYPYTWVIGTKMYIKFSHQTSNGLWWSTASSITWFERLIYQGDFAHQDKGYESIFAASGSSLRPNKSADIWPAHYTTPSEAQYYVISDIPWNNNFNIIQGVTGTNTQFNVNTANFKSFYIKATGDGGQPWWEKWYSNSN